MAYFVTGATGLIGRHLVQELLDNRHGEVFLLVSPASRAPMERLVDGWGRDGRVTVVPGELAEAALGVDPAWVAEHRGTVDHFFHLATGYDLTAPAEDNETLVVGGTRNALELAADLDAGVFHHLSSVAASGDYRGFWDETMFDVDQALPSPYHRTSFDAERAVREESAVPYRVYRTPVVLGHSATGAIDEADGFYHLFPILKRLRDVLPSWAPLVGVDLGDTNVVPVDYVARAMDHLAHLPGRDGEAFHLVDPVPHRIVDVLGVFAEAAGAPRLVTPIDRTVTAMVPAGLLPRTVRPGSLVKGALRSAPARVALRETVGRLGVPLAAVAHLGFPATYGARVTEQALAGSGIALPPLESYAARLWSYWEEQLDDSVVGDPGVVDALRGRIVVVAGASSAVGRVTAYRVAQAGGVPVLVAGTTDALDGVRSSIEARGGTAHVYACDLAEPGAVDDLVGQVTAELGAVDFVVLSSGDPADAATEPSLELFADLERAMQLNCFGAIRLFLGLLPAMRQQGRGYVVSVSTVPDPDLPASSGYAASTAALDAWCRAVGPQVAPDGITFASVELRPLHPAQAADLVVRTLTTGLHP